MNDPFENGLLYRMENSNSWWFIPKKGEKRQPTVDDIDNLDNDKS